MLQHVVWGGVESDSQDQSSSASHGFSDSGDTIDKGKSMSASAAGRVDIEKLTRWRINPDEIHFTSDQDSNSKSSSSFATELLGTEEGHSSAHRGPSATSTAHRGSAAPAADSTPLRRQRLTRPLMADSTPSQVPSLWAEAAGASQAQSRSAPELLSQMMETDFDSDDSGPGQLTAMERHQQILQQQMRPEMMEGVDLEALRAKVPRDSNGQPTSMGSLGHDVGECKLCIFNHSKLGCFNGIACNFCHFSHRRGRHGNKQKPCKGKRDRYRKLITRLASEIECDPYSFSVEALQLPPSIASNEAARAKLLSKMQLHAEQGKAERCSTSDGTQPSRIRSL